MNQPRTLSRSSRRPLARGLSLPEVMISLTITAGLLVSVAGAFVAASSAVDSNDQFFRATQAARVSLNQLTNEIRRADVVQVNSGSQLDVQRPAENMPAANEIYRRYAYDSTGKRLTMQIFYSGGTSSAVYTLARNVSSASFGPADTGQDSLGQTVVTRVPITVKVAVGKNSVTLTGSAGPRRALKQ